MLYWQTDAQKSQSGLFVLFGAHSWRSIQAAQHRVATDAPVGAFKIGPILWESLCHVSSSSPPGSRLNANRSAAIIKARANYCHWLQGVSSLASRLTKGQVLVDYH